MTKHEEGIEQCDVLDKHLEKMIQQSTAYATGKHESLGNIEATWREYKKTLKRIRKAAVALGGKDEV